LVGIVNMETALIFSEIVFNLTISLAVMVVGVLMTVIAYHLVSVAQDLKKISDNITNVSSEVGERISEALERLSELPVLSYFFRKRPSKYVKEGRVKVINKKYSK